MKLILAVAMLAASVIPASASLVEGPTVRERLEVLTAQGRRSCKAAKTCRDAVIMWCVEGYAGADRDNDGIPCESVCRSRAQVQEIMAEVGC